MREHPVRFCEGLWLKCRGLLSFLQSRCGYAYDDRPRPRAGSRIRRMSVLEAGAQYSHQPERVAHAYRDASEMVHAAAWDAAQSERRRTLG